jgi:hypothetical protein
MEIREAVTCDRDEMEKQAREHAWSWFALHATQRIQNLNFFLVSTAFLITSYASLLEKHPGAAVGVAILGAWIAFWFHRMDVRTKQLADAAEDALEPLQARLADQVGVAQIKILHSVATPVQGASKYRTVISVIQWSVAVGFLIAGVYAGGIATNHWR